MVRLSTRLRRSLSKLTSHHQRDSQLVQDTSPKEPERFESPDRVCGSPTVCRVASSDPVYSPAIQTAYTLTFLETSSEPQDYQSLTDARIQLLQQLAHQDGAAIVGATDLEEQLKGTLQGLNSESDEEDHTGGQVWKAYRRLVDVEKELLAVNNESGEEEGIITTPTSQSSSTDAPTTCTLLTNPEQLPQPRHEVLRRLQVSESSRSLFLTRPDIPRRGSANGFHVASLVMSNIEDHGFVLPYLHHIKHHEVRGLKTWLVDRDFVRQSHGISRIEKILHCIQLLQAGMRYESIAVVFSRTPRQIMGSCHEVMKGLLKLYEETVDESNSGEVYEGLWGIAKRYAISQLPKLEKYYGFRWEEIKKVLVALNVYIGRWRGSTSPLEGRVFRWGSYLGNEDIGRLGVLEEASSSDESDQESVHVVEVKLDDYNERSSNSSGSTYFDTSGSSLYEEPVVQALAQPVWYRKI
jgi:hypothetical protein